MISNKLVAEFEKNQRAIAKFNKQIENVVGNIIQKRDALEEANKNMREAIYEAMEANDVDKFDGDLIAITRVKPTARTTFDSKLFAKERPKTYEKYLRTSDVKGSIRLKVKA